MGSFQVLEADAPQAPPADLDCAQLSTADQAPDEARLHVELFGCLLDCQPLGEADYIAEACRRTASRIAAGDLLDDGEQDSQ